MLLHCRQTNSVINDAYLSVQITNFHKKLRLPTKPYFTLIPVKNHIAPIICTIFECIIFMKIMCVYKNKIKSEFSDKSDTALALHFENARRVLYSAIVLILCLTFLPNNVSAQIPPDNLSGEELRIWLKQNWYDGEHNELGYNEARRKMYGFIDNHNDTITCVYSGFWQLNDFGNEVTFPNPINTEHTVPQSFFNQAEPMRSDIHAIFPTFLNWNSERGNSPLSDIPDSNTERWMRDDDSQGNVPNSNIDEYSESISNSVFEPREDHKGNAARAIMYFYTMYPQVGQITSVASVETLCAWHAADPPDAREIARNDGTEQYQGNRNPYIDLPQLAERAWGCTVTSTTAPEENPADLVIAPNPFNGRFALTFSSDSNEKITIHLYDLNGRQLQESIKAMPSNGTLNLEFDQPLADGMFILTLRQGENIYPRKLINQ